MCNAHIKSILDVAQNVPSATTKCCTKLPTQLFYTRAFNRKIFINQLID